MSDVSHEGPALFEVDGQLVDRYQRLLLPLRRDSLPCEGPDLVDVREVDTGKFLLRVSQRLEQDLGDLPANVPLGGGFAGQGRFAPPVGIAHLLH